jgi:hypothetical protein
MSINEFSFSFEYEGRGFKTYKKLNINTFDV